MSWTEDDRTNNVELAIAALPATAAQWAEIHKLSSRTDWKNSLTREQAAELISILSGRSYEAELTAELDEIDDGIISTVDGDDDFDFYGEAA